MRPEGANEMSYSRDRFECQSYPLSVALQHAGYRVPGAVFLREGKIAEAIERFTEEGNVDMLVHLRKIFENKLERVQP